MKIWDPRVKDDCNILKFHIFHAHIVIWLIFGLETLRYQATIYKTIFHLGQAITAYRDK